MQQLFNKRVIVGITGGIAAYKGAELVRRFKEAGADVRVVMTPAATRFITPLTLQALSGRPVHVELLDAAAENGMDHISLARWADAVVVAPATADILARLAHGRADALLRTQCHASTAPLLPARCRVCGCWSPPARPMRCSTRCAISATAAPARWATPQRRQRPRPVRR